MRLFRPLWFWYLFAALVGVCGWLIYDEARTSALQARFLSAYAAKMTYALEPGENPALRVPTTGPYNQRLGYTAIPQFTSHLQQEGFDVAWQMRTSPTFNAFVDAGGFPIYHSKNSGGLTIYDRHGAIMHQTQFPTRVFSDFAAVPPLLVASLQFIEDRAVLASPYKAHNPAVDWGRFVQAIFGKALAHIAPHFDMGGGSTLATQIEKFRHSEGGRTNGAVDKLRQMLSASLRAYRDGADTSKARQTIVLDYLNATPLAARPGWGEINGIGDGLWAWFGIDLGTAAQAIQNEETPALLPRKAFMFKHALALILAERRPSYYLITNQPALEQLTNTTLARLQAQGLITQALQQAAQATPLQFAPNPPEMPQPSFIVQKASNAIRHSLSNSLGLTSLYDLDHIDAAVGTTLDMETQTQVTQFLQQLHDPAFVKTIGLEGFRLLNPDNDPTKINWTIVLFERTAQGNALRVQADNLDQPLDLNDGAKLDLGSTAKLRTLTTYLEIITELHQHFSPLEDDALQEIQESDPDRLTAWALEWLRANPERNSRAMLDAAMQRTYSANPGESFFTGGGLHSFHNFEPLDNSRTVTLAEALRKSINLPFIRLMRDIVSYENAQGANPKREVLGDPDNPARQEFLKRFAASEGMTYLNQFYNQYQSLTPEVAVAKLMRMGNKRDHALAVIFRSLFPTASEASFIKYIRTLRPDHPSSDQQFRKVFASYPKDRFDLVDRSYVAGVHPLELWLIDYRLHHPKATHKEINAASAEARQESYRWLFKSSHAAQNSRIRSLLEADAFTAIHARWVKLGYPFERLVPSLATAIGSSADRPGALATLMGIILNDGVRLPAVRANYINFAMETPFQTMLARRPPEGERVMDIAVAQTLRTALRDVVANGTARRVDGAFVAPDGTPIPVRGKTGTGDHRFDTFAAGGRLVSSRVVNRTATLVFSIGDRFFGSITAYVAGEQAATYHFTSALPAQMLRSLAPTLLPLINGKPEGN